MYTLKLNFNPINFFQWGYSSVGRALLLHGRCQRFESAYLHKIERILEFENFITFKKVK